MTLRFMIFTSILTMSLSACGTAMVVVSAPIPIKPPMVGNAPTSPLVLRPELAEEAKPPSDLIEPNIALAEPAEVSMGEEASFSVPDSDARPPGIGPSRNIANQRKKATQEPPQTPAPVDTGHGFISGSAAYQIPPYMVENQASPVDLWIDASLSVEDLKAQLNSFLIENTNRAILRSGQPAVKSKSVGTTQIVGKEVLIGKKMYAELIGPDFEIQPSGPREQTYIESRPLRWSWLVKPKLASKEGLPLEIRVMADPGEGQTPVETIREVVIVQARKQSWREIFEAIDWWIKLLGGGGVGAVVVVTVKYFLSRRKSGRKGRLRKGRS